VAGTFSGRRTGEPTVADEEFADGEPMVGMWAGSYVYEVTSAPYAGDQCVWRSTGEIRADGTFTQSDQLTLATGIGQGFCISGQTSGFWQRSGDQVVFDITYSSAYLIGTIYRHAGTLLEDGRRIVVSGQGVEQGIGFRTFFDIFKIQ
jgi:hypothetical protein